MLLGVLIFAAGVFIVAGVTSVAGRGLLLQLGVYFCWGQWGLVLLLLQRCALMAHAHWRLELYSVKTGGVPVLGLASRYQ